MVEIECCIQRILTTSRRSERLGGCCITALRCRSSQSALLQLLFSLGQGRTILDVDGMLLLRIESDGAMCRTRERRPLRSAASAAAAATHCLARIVFGCVGILSTE